MVTAINCSGQCDSVRHVKCVVSVAASQIEATVLDQENVRTVISVEVLKQTEGQRFGIGRVGTGFIHNPGTDGIDTGE